MQNDPNAAPRVVHLKTQLVSQGHTRRLLAETELATLRVHCYAPGTGENTLHAHLDEDHIFLVLQGTARFSGLDGAAFEVPRHHAIVLPKGCFYQFSNCGSEPLVMVRFGASTEKADRRIAPDGRPIPGRSSEPGYVPPVFVEAFFE